MIWISPENVSFASTWTTMSDSFPMMFFVLFIICSTTCVTAASGSSWSMMMFMSTNVFAPDFLTRILVILFIPRIFAISACIFVSIPCGALSISSSMFSFPSLMLIHRTISATPIAAMLSAMAYPSFVRISPASTTVELSMSVLKCIASAFSAWLPCFLAALNSWKDLSVSIRMAVITIANAQKVTSTSCVFNTILLVAS